MVKVVNCIILFKVLYIFENLHLISCALSKRNVKNNNIFLPAVVEFEIKGNSLVWLPFKTDENESNIDYILHSVYLSKNDRKRRHLDEDASFVSGVLSCGNNTGTIEPDVIYDDEDDYESVESTTMADANVDGITNGTTRTLSNVTGRTSEMGSRSSRTNEMGPVSGARTEMTTSLDKINVKITQTTMPVKISIDECTTKEMVPPPTIIPVITISSLEPTTKEVTNECFLSVEEYFTLPQIITPPNPFPPLDLDFLPCDHIHTTLKKTKESGMSTKCIEYDSNRSPPKHYSKEGFKTTTEIENIEKTTTKLSLTTKKPEQKEKTTELSNKSTLPGEKQIESSSEHESKQSEEFSATTLSKLERFFPPLRKWHNHQRTTEKFSTTTSKKKHKTTSSKKKHKTTSSKRKHKTTTSKKKHKTTNSKFKHTSAATKHTKTIKTTTTAAKKTEHGTKTSTKKKKTSTAHKTIYAKEQPTTTDEVTTEHISPTKLTKTHHEGPFFSLQKFLINDDKLKELKKFPSPSFSNMDHNYNKMFIEEILKNRPANNLQETIMSNYHEKFIPQVNIRMPSTVSNGSVVTDKDPKTAALFPSAISTEDNNQVLIPLQYPFFGPILSNLPYDSYISTSQYNPINLLLKKEDSNNLDTSPDLNSELNFNPYSIWPFFVSSKERPLTSSKYSIISKYNFLYPQNDHKLRRKRKISRKLKIE